MDKYHVKPEHIILEITDSAVIRDKGRVDSIIHQLNNAGFEYASDDFRTGKSNYSYVHEFPFSIIEIDKSFLWAADKNSTDRAVLTNMLRLVKDLNLKNVVEGGETKEQRDKPIKDGVNYLQGYYYSKPVPQDQFISDIHIILLV